MPFSTEAGPDFEKALRRLAKKYHSLGQDLRKLAGQLQTTPTLGTPIGKGCYKIRLAIASKGKGKRGGGRVITYVAVVRETVYLLTMYDKSEQESLSSAELDALLAGLPDTDQPV